MRTGAAAVASEIVVAIIVALGSLAGTYFSNRKNNALISYRLEQVEHKVDKLDVSNDLQKIRERLARLEERVNGGE